jgi:hypothetical protein
MLLKALELVLLKALALVLLKALALVLLKASALEWELQLVLVLLVKPLLVYSTQVFCQI